MLRLTPTAVTHLVNVRRERGVDEGAGARFVSQGRRVRLTFESAPRDGDTVLKAPEIEVFVANDIADALDRSVIDAQREEDKTILVLRRQTATGSATSAAKANPATKAARVSTRAAKASTGPAKASTGPAKASTSGARKAD
jgi:Fe-S cluster assembly iron-binding protein IscA